MGVKMHSRVFSHSGRRLCYQEGERSTSYTPLDSSRSAHQSPKRTKSHSCLNSPHSSSASTSSTTLYTNTRWNWRQTARHYAMFSQATSLTPHVFAGGTVSWRTTLSLFDTFREPSTLRTDSAGTSKDYSRGQAKPTNLIDLLTQLPTHYRVSLLL